MDNIKWTIDDTDGVSWGDTVVHKTSDTTFKIETGLTAKKTGLYSIELQLKNGASDIADLIIIPGKVENVRWQNNACGHNEDSNIGAIHRKLDLEWNSIENVHGYTIEISPMQNFPESDTNSLDIGLTTSYVDNESRKRESLWYVRIAAYISEKGKLYNGQWSDTLVAEICGHSELNDFFDIKNDTDLFIRNRGKSVGEREYPDWQKEEYLEHFMIDKYSLRFI